MRRHGNEDPFEPWLRLLMALFVVIGGGIWVVFGEGIENIERRAAVVTGVAGTIIGYYFGARGIERVRDERDDAHQVGMAASIRRTLANVEDLRLREDTERRAMAEYLAFIREKNLMNELEAYLVSKRDDEQA